MNVEMEGGKEKESILITIVVCSVQCAACSVAGGGGENHSAGRCRHSGRSTVCRDRWWSVHFKQEEEEYEGTRYKGTSRSGMR